MQFKCYCKYGKIQTKYYSLMKNILLCFLFFTFSLKKRVSKMKTRIPKVSIFMPIFNKELFLRRSLNSIRNQTLKDLEIIAINDCSTDNSLKVLKELSLIDNRIKIINNDRNHGLLYSRAMGILNCSGEYVINLDPDDKFSNEKDLETLYSMAKSHKSDLIIYRYKKIFTFKDKKLEVHSDIKINKSNYTSQKMKKIHLITNKFIKKDIILKSYKYFEKYIFNCKWNYGEDNIWSLLIL